MFFYKVEGHMPKLSSFGRGKTIRPKESLTSLLHAALQLRFTAMVTYSFHLYSRSSHHFILFMYLFYTDPPENVQFLTTASANKACLNDVVNFTCSADAFPQVTSYQLFVDDMPNENSSTGMWSKPLSNNGASTYKCVANNTVGSTSSASVSISVGGKYDNHVDRDTCTCK